MPTDTSAKILVTGATGKVGRELVGLLAAAGTPVRVLVRRKEQAGQFAGPGVEVSVGDFNRPDTLPEALEGVEKLYLVYPDRPDRISAEQNLIDAAKRAGVCHIVKQSAFAASLQPPVSFGISLARTDQYLIDSGLEWTILRPYAFMQNLLDVADIVNKRGLLPMPFGRAKVCFIDCRDIAAVAREVLTTQGHTRQTYYLSGPEAVGLAQVADTMARLLERKVSYLSPPFFIAKQGMKKSMSDYELSLLKPLLKMIRAGGEELPFADVARICQRQPRNIETFLQDHLAAFAPKTGSSLQ